MLLIQILIQCSDQLTAYYTHLYAVYHGLYTAVNSGDRVVLKTGDLHQ